MSQQKQAKKKLPPQQPRQGTLDGQVLTKTGNHYTKPASTTDVVQRIDDRVIIPTSWAALVQDSNVMLNKQWVCIYGQCGGVDIQPYGITMNMTTIGENTRIVEFPCTADVDAHCDSSVAAKDEDATFTASHKAKSTLIVKSPISESKAEKAVSKSEYKEDKMDSEEEEEEDFNDESSVLKDIEKKDIESQNRTKLRMLKAAKKEQWYSLKGRAVRIIGTLTKQRKGLKEPERLGMVAVSVQTLSTSEMKCHDLKEKLYQIETERAIALSHSKTPKAAQQVIPIPTNDHKQVLNCFMEDCDAPLSPQQVQEKITSQRLALELPLDTILDDLTNKFMKLFPDENGSLVFLEAF